MSLDAYRGIHALLTDPDGLDLEIAGSMFMYATHALCHSSISYFDGDSGTISAHAPFLRDAVKSGWIDTLHAYGDFDGGGFTRAHAERTLEEFERNGLKLGVWTNHGSSLNSQNIGHRELSDYQQGDDPKQPAYHLDITRQFGVRWFWVDNALQTSPFEAEPICYPARARDGSEITIFRRYRGLAGKPAPNCQSLAEQITETDLDEIVRRNAVCVYYQHLGVARRNDDGSFDAATEPYFDDAAMTRLAHLSRRQKEGRCLVAGLARLLRYLEVRDALRLRLSDNILWVQSDEPGLRPSDLNGVSLDVPKRLRIDRSVLTDGAGAEHELHFRQEVRSDQPSDVFHIPWQRLERVRF